MHLLLQAFFGRAHERGASQNSIVPQKWGAGKLGEILSNLMPRGGKQLLKSEAP